MCRNTFLYNFSRNKYAYGFLKHICQLWIGYYSRSKSRNVKISWLQLQTRMWFCLKIRRNYLNLTILVTTIIFFRDHLVKPLNLFCVIFLCGSLFTFLSNFFSSLCSFLFVDSFCCTFSLCYCVVFSVNVNKV
jgi:hypothetical protein